MAYKFNPFTSKLEEYGPILTGTGTVSAAADGTAALPGIAFTSDTNTGIYRPGADQLAIATAGTGRLFVDASGTVNVAQQLLIDNNKEIRFKDSGGTSRTTLVLDSSNDLKLGTSAGGNLIFVNGSSYTERARIDSSGRLLVGTSTALTNIYTGASATTPQIQLSGAGLPESSLSLLRTGTTGATVFLNAGSSGNNVISGSITGRFVFNGYDGTNYRTSAQITAEVDGTPGANDMPGRLVFSTTADGASSPTERLRITSDGKVGLGTSNVATVFGGNALEIENSSGSELILSNSTQGLAGNEFIGGVVFQNNDTSGSPPHYAGIWAKANDAFGYSNLYLAAGRDAYEAGTPHVTINYLGNVGVGSANPQRKLVVSEGGAQGFEFYPADGSGGNTLNHYNRSTSAFITVTTNADQHIWARTDGEKARIDSSGRLLVGTSSSSSEAKLVVQGGTSIPPGRFSVQRSNATVVNGTVIGTVDFATVGNKVVAEVTAAGTATWTDGVSHPTQLSLATTPSNGTTPQVRMIVKQSGIINFANTPTYADNTAALAGGLVAGDVYRKSDGTLMITY